MNLIRQKAHDFRSPIHRPVSLLSEIEHGVGSLIETELLSRDDQCRKVCF